MKNFEFEHEGKKYWYSRSICTVALLFAKDSLGKWYVLTNKRGLTEKYKYVTIDDIAYELRDGKNGIGGIGANGKMIKSIDR